MQQCFYPVSVKNIVMYTFIFWSLQYMVWVDFVMDAVYFLNILLSFIVFVIVCTERLLNLYSIKSLAYLLNMYGISTVNIYLQAYLN